MSPGSLPRYRPAGIDGPTWCQARRDFIAASQEPGRTTELRTALAQRLGIRLEQLRIYARRCGWPGMQHRNGRRR